MAAPTDLLRRVPLFRGLDDKHLDTLSRTFTDRTFRAGQDITSEGGGGVGFFVIEDGEAVVTVHGEVRMLIEGTGEVALIDEGSRSATITAVTDVKCYGLTPWQFRPLVEENLRSPGRCWSLWRSGYAKSRADRASSSPS
jgi:CRP-like cAMP-binding protein